MSIKSGPMEGVAGNRMSEMSSNRPKSFMQMAEVGSLGTWGTVLAILSTIVGGGMLGIPWACFNCGFFLSLAVGIIAAAQVLFGSVLFLRARENCPD